MKHSHAHTHTHSRTFEQRKPHSGSKEIFLKPKTPPLFPMGLNGFSNFGMSALRFREAMLKNNIETLANIDCLMV